MNKFTICFEIHSFWRAGTGHGSGAILDMEAQRDTDGLPYLPGRTVKGVLRKAVCRAEDWGYIPEGRTEEWFGGSIQDDNVSDLGGQPGCLRVSDAVLPIKLRTYLCNQYDKSQLCAGFFHSIYATKIENGVAAEKSLRSGEVVIPLNLYAELEAPSDWSSVEFETCLPLIRAIGNETSRGLGRVTVTLKEGEEDA